LTALSQATAPKPHPLLADTLAHPLLTSLNMVECHSKDLNQPDLCLASSLQANILPNKADTVDRLLNLLLNTQTNRWAMEHLPALVVMVEVLSKLPTRSGVHRPVKPTETASAATNNKHGIHSASCQILRSN
jgi:hypothetical protein